MNQMLENIKAVIFDLDGSLVDSMWIWQDIDVEYLGRFGLTIPQGLQTAIEGMSFSETAAYFKQHFQIPDPIEKIKEDWNQMAWEKYTHKVPLKDGVHDFLIGYRDREIPLGIATSNSRELVENIAEVHGLKHFFHCIKTGCEVAHGKPWPDIYLAVAEELKTAPEHCLVFEDILPGIWAGKRAGMKVCAVEDAYSADVRDAKIELADYYIQDFHSLWV